MDNVLVAILITVLVVCIVAAVVRYVYKDMKQEVEECPVMWMRIKGEAYRIVMVTSVMIAWVMFGFALLSYVK